MPRGRVELLQEALNALDEGGVEAVLEYMHPAFEFSTPPAISLEPDTYSGHDGLRRYFASFYEAMDDVHIVPEEFIEVGERVVVPLRLVARGKQTGIESAQPAVGVWRVEGERITGLEIFAGRDEALEAARRGA